MQNIIFFIITFFINDFFKINLNLMIFCIVFKIKLRVKFKVKKVKPVNWKFGMEGLPRRSVRVHPLAIPSPIYQCQPGRRRRRSCLVPPHRCSSWASPNPWGAAPTAGEVYRRGGTGGGVRCQKRWRGALMSRAWSRTMQSPSSRR